MRSHNSGTFCKLLDYDWNWNLSHPVPLKPFQPQWWTGTRPERDGERKYEHFSFTSKVCKTEFWKNCIVIVPVSRRYSFTFQSSIESLLSIVKMLNGRTLIKISLRYLTLRFFWFWVQTPSVPIPIPCSFDSSNAKPLSFSVSVSKM